jgi:hypothetical protein
MRIGSFVVESIGVQHANCFQGYGLGPSSDYDECVFGIGDTEAEALDDCLEQASNIADIDDATEACIRAEFGVPDDCTADCDAYYYVGLKWCDRDARREARIRKIPHLEFCRYNCYDRLLGCVEKAGKSVSYGNFKFDDEGRYFTVPFASGSDYSGSTLERSNYLWWVEQYGKCAFTHTAHGGYNTYALYICLDELLAVDDDMFEAVCEALEALAEYPCFDEEAQTMLESDLSDEAWEEWVSEEFVRAIEKEYRHCDFDFSDECAFRVFFEKMCESANCYWYNEGYGHDMYVDVDKVVEYLTIVDLKDFVVKYIVSYNNVGETREEYLTEDGAIKRVAQLRNEGKAEATYAIG